MMDGVLSSGIGMNVRVVRCPNCQKLLPEIGDVAVYRCGGCDATLQAKRPLRVSETSTEVTDVQRRECDMDSEKKSVTVNMERAFGMPDGLPAQFDGVGLKPVEVCNGGSVLVKNASTRTDNEGNGGHNRKEMVISDGVDTSFGHNSASVSEVSVLKESDALTTGALPKDSQAKSSGIKFQLLSEKTVRDKSPFVNGLSRKDVAELPEAKQPVSAPHSAHQAGEKGLKRNRVTGFPMENVLGRSYPDEGPSNYHHSRGYRYGDYVPDTNHDMDTARRVGYLEQNRAELLRMLDELRDQVQRTCKVSDKQQANIGHVDGMAASSSSCAPQDHANWLPESSSLFKRNPSRRSPLYDHNFGMMNFHPNLPLQSDITCYPGSSVPWRAPHMPGEHQQADSCICGQFDPDLLKPYHHESFYNQPACSCPHCHQRQFPVPARGATTVVGQQRVPYCVNNRDFYPTDGPSICAPRGSNTRTVNAPLHSIEQRAHGRRAVRNAGPYCRPVSGAAPFCICFNCYELLQLPEEPLSSKRNQFTLQCGSCSVVIPVKRVGNRLVAAAPFAASRSHTMLENSSSNSGDNSGNDFHSTDEKLVLPYIFNSEDHEMLEKAHASNQMDTKKMLHFSSSSSPSRHRDSSESLIVQNGGAYSSEIASEAQVISRVSSLPLREHFGYSPSDSAVDRSGQGSRSARSDQERKISSDNTRPNLAKDVQMPIVMDVPADEYPPAGLSQDSWDMISKDEVQPRVNKAGDSFITGFIKNFRFNQGMSHTRYKVSVNGHPIPDRVIKKAEKLAGPISPGDYWYDYRAGFWGVMGHQCLGIIPPFIEELNYPMPKKCAGGDTGILVNGRELHKKDLDLLLGRGLPNTKGCSYIVDISGKVWDESSGEELDGLGKLAPTIEKLKRGFGMRCPRAVA